MKPPNVKGPGVAAPSPDAIALVANALSAYLQSLPESKRNGEWVAVPRAMIECAIDVGIGWLDLSDQFADDAVGPGEHAENAP